MSSVPHCPSKSLAHRIHAHPTRAEHAAYWGYECGKTRAGKVGLSRPNCELFAGKSLYEEVVARCKTSQSLWPAGLEPPPF